MEYTVQSGDTLSAIAAKACGGSISWEQIAADNRITNPHALQIGQVLVLNCDAPTPSPVVTPPVPQPVPAPPIVTPVPVPPVALHWGADSAGYTSDGTPTRFANVAQQYGFPHFWGRYIGANYSLTAQEVQFIFNQGSGNCRILLIYNGARPSSLSEGYPGGVMDANRAIAAAQSLGVPTDRGIVIYADIEAGWVASPGWILGWWATMNASPYGNPGGFYCNPGSTFANPLAQAISDPSNQNPRSGQPFRPLVYSSEPENVGCDFDRSYFRPDFPACCTADEAVIWQYTGTCGGTEPFDLDMASEAGYATMWGR